MTDDKHEPFCLTCGKPNDGDGVDCLVCEQWWKDNPPSTDDKLKPCPTKDCEGAGEVQYDCGIYYVECSVCEGQGPKEWTETEAVMGWNYRPEARATDTQVKHSELADIERARAILKQFYPEMRDDYSGRRVQILVSALEEIAVFAEVRSKDDSKTFSRVNRGALRNIAQKARAALDGVESKSDA